MLNAAVKRAVLSSFFNVSVEAGGVDSEKARQNHDLKYIAKSTI